MKYLILCLLSGFTFSMKGAPLQEPDTVAALLQKTAAELNRLQTVRYYHQRDYFNGEQHFITQGFNYIDFVSTDTLIGLKYQVRTADESYIFNGSECFTLQQKKGTIQINNNPKVTGMQGGSFFYNSLVTLRRTLSLIASDLHSSKELKDTVIDGKSCYLVHFSLYKKTLDAFGGFNPITEDRTFSFQLFIHKKDYLPLMLIQHNSVDEHSSKVTYSKIEVNPTVAEDSWYYSTYLPAFKKEEKKEAVLLPVGTKASLFELSLFDKASTPVDALHYKGKVLLLEFWIRNCGPCIAAVPKLNQLTHEYKDKGVEVLAINPVDTKPTIAFFIEKYKTTYPVAYNGSGIAEAFGVTAFPAVFILDRKGTIVYAGGFNEAAVKKVLQKALR